jgi:hypothetical protein
MEMEKRAGAQQQLKRAAEPPPRVITAGAEKSSFGAGFQQNGEHDPS